MLSPAWVAQSFPKQIRSHLCVEPADNLVPALVWGALTLAKGFFLAQYLVAGSQGASGLAYTSVLLQIAATTVFTALIFGFFAIRKPVLSQRASVTDRFVAFTGTLLPLALFAHAPDLQAPVLLLVSTLFILTGTGIASVAQLTLGRHFGIAPEVRGLVTTGVYRYVRHPIYLGEITAVLGATISAASWLTILIFLVFCLVQYRRTYLEERTLKKVFPAYRAYQIQTWRIVPGLH